MRRGIKIRLIVLGSLLGVVLIVGGVIWAIVHEKLIRTQALSTAQLDEIDIDYTPMIQGRWSPWRVDTGGDRVWDPVAGFNGWVRSLSDDERAWPGIYAFSQQHAAMFEHDDVGARPHGADDFGFIRAWHKEPANREAVDGLCRVLMRPYMGALLSDLEDEILEDPIGPMSAELRDGGTNISMLDSLRQPLGPLRRAVGVLSNGAMVAIEEGDSDRFVALISAALGSQHLVDECPNAIDQLVRIACQIQCYYTVMWALETHPDALSEAHLAALDGVIASNAVDGYNPLGEALFLEDTLRRYATEDAQFRFGAIADAFINDKDLWDLQGPPTSRPVRAFDASLQQPLWLLLVANRYGASASTLPWDGSDIEMPDLVPAGMELNPVSSRFAKIYTAAYDRVAQRCVQHAQERVGARTAIALHRHRLRHGSFPGSVPEIDADLLGFEPTDFFTGEALRLTTRESGVCLYSVGADRIDDGGEPIWVTMLGSDVRTVERGMEWISAESAEAVMAYEPHTISGDFVLYPVPRNDPMEED